MRKKNIDRNQVILVDREDQPVGWAEKAEAHRNPLLHRAFSIFLYHEDKLLIQQRAFHKYHSGGLWANTCCSHPAGELDLIDDAEERLYEETGIRCPVREIFAFEYEHQFAEDLYEHEYDHVMVGEFQGQFKINPEEVEAMRWISFSDLELELAQDSGTFAPWFLIAAPQVLAYLRKYSSNLDK